MACAAAAATGARRGSRSSQSSRISQCAHGSPPRADAWERRSIARMEAQINEQVLRGVLSAYDTDCSRTIDREEARTMLRDVGLQCLDIDEYPSAEDIDFLYCLCNLKEGRSLDAVAGHNILLICDAWKSYLKRRDEVAEIFATFDLNDDGKIQQSELPAVLRSLNGGKDVPDDVVLWVLQQADLTGDGVLNAMELARGMCACYQWLGVEDPKGVIEHLGNHVEKAAELPRPRRSSMMANACSLM